MRVLQVVPTYLPATRYGGPIHSVHGLAKGLVANGVETDVCTTNVDGGACSDVPLGERVNVDGVGVFYFRSDLLRRLYYSRGMVRFLQSRLADYDLVHLHSVFLWPTWKASRVAWRRGVPSVVSPRGMLVPALVKSRSRWVKTAWINAIEKRNLKRTGGIHFTSRLEMDEAQAYLPSGHLSQVIVPNGVDDCASAEELPPYEVRDAVLFLGRVNWKKNLHDVLRAAAALRGVDLLVAGPGEVEELQSLQRLAAELGISDRVQFLGEVKAEQKMALFDRARVLVLNSFNENFGNVVIEAMARGCPVVINRFVGAAEVVRSAEAGEIADGSIDNLTACLERLWNDRARWQGVQQNGLKAVRENYLWSELARQMVRFYSDVIRA